MPLLIVNAAANRLERDLENTEPKAEEAKKLLNRYIAQSYNPIISCSLLIACSGSFC